MLKHKVTPIYNHVSDILPIIMMRSTVFFREKENNDLGRVEGWKGEDVEIVSACSRQSGYSDTH